jgi:hypothetical protein
MGTAADSCKALQLIVSTREISIYAVTKRAFFGLDLAAESTARASC